MQTLTPNEVVMTPDEVFVRDAFDAMLDAGHDIPTALDMVQAAYPTAFTWPANPDFAAWLAGAPIR